MIDSLNAALTGGQIALIVIAGLLLIFLIVVVIIVPVGLWFRALISGAHVPMSRLAGMRLRKMPVAEIVNEYIRATKAGINFDIDQMENHKMAGGNLSNIVNALISANSSRISLTLDDAKAIDLAGRDVWDAIRKSVDPYIIDIKDVSAIAKDGIELKVSVRATVRVNMSCLRNGAGENTIIARIGEGIVSAVGDAATYREILAKPDLISYKILDANLSSGTAYEIVSLDVADIDVGENKGATIRMQTAKADMEIAKSKAEERRVNAIALEQEMKAETQRMQAKVVSAEAQVPMAIAEALKKGQLGVMDYYKMKNIDADTKMRSSFVSDSSSDSDR